jgi:uncharacterized membrane protein
MIQRKQTLWLLITIIAMIVSAFVPFAYKSLIDELGVAKLQSITTRSITLLSLNTAAIIVMSFLAIFMYKQRKYQKILCLIGLVFSISLIVLEVLHGNKSAENTAVTFGIGLPCIAVLLLVKSYSDINADDKLVKSVDRLRD